MTTLYYGRLSPIAITATNAQAGYGAGNLDLSPIARAWYGTGVGATDLIFDLGAMKALGCIMLHDVNFAAAVIHTGDASAVYTNRGTLNAYANDLGRRRGVFDLSTITARYVKVAIGAGSAQDGLPYWRAGAAHIMGTKLSMARSPNKGFAVRTLFAQLKQQLMNRRNAVAQTGLALDEISLSFFRKYDQSLETFKTQIRLAPCILDMQLTQHPAHVWPVINQDDEYAREYPKANSETSALKLMEVA